jgi:hypothetical protein
LIEFTLVLVLIIFSVRMGDRDGVSGNRGVGTSSKVSDMFDAWVEMFESTIELSIVDDVGEVISKEG